MIDDLNCRDPLFQMLRARKLIIILNWSNSRIAKARHFYRPDYTKADTCTRSYRSINELKVV